MIKPILLVMALAACSSGARAQENLVPNPGFESMSYCPSNFNQQQLTLLQGWTQPGEGTPDYFNACSKKVGVPINLFGNQAAYDGDGYLGLVTFAPGKRNYREYMQAKLSRTLVPGEQVCIEVRLSAADYSLYVTDGFGICVTREKLTSSRNENIRATPVIDNPHLNMLDETGEWMLLSDVVTAEGGEQFITIGNFHADMDLKILKRTRDMGATETSNWAYLFVDQVVVKPVKSRDECSCSRPLLASQVHDPPLELLEYDQIRLDAVLFDFDMDLLTDTAIIELNEIKRLLKSNPNMQMEIMGHTDIQGGDEYNLDLSRRRAQKVIDYLISKGIESARLSIAFFGKDKPVADNSTEEGRALNRRVEFQVIEKKFQLIQ